MGKTNTKNNDKKNFVEEKLANHKFALLASMAVSFALNLFLVVLLSINGISFGYIIFPALICAFDIVFFTVSLFTNFKFSYSVLYTVIFVVMFTVSSAVYALILMNFGKDTAITYFALAFWVISAVLTVFAVVFGVARAGKPRGAIRAMISLIIFCVAVGGYSYYIIGSGFFGQGTDSESRPVTFVYDSENQYYVATGLLDGKGKNVIIPQTFNDVKVGAIDCSIFTNNDIKTVTINSSDFVLKNIDELSNITSDFTVLMPKADISDFTSYIYSLAVQSEDNIDECISFARRFKPSDIAANEVYISFAYDSNSIFNAEGSYLPIWVANKNDIFNLSYASAIAYVQNSNVNDENLLATLYNAGASNGGYIISAVADGGGRRLNGAAISESIDNVVVAFDKIYRIQVENDNDTRYEVEDSFRYLDESDSTKQYRFVTLETSNALLPQITGRNGFSLTWKCAYGTGSNKESFTELSAALNNYSGRSVSLYPEWSLLAPGVVECNTSDNRKTYTYGDNATLFVNATAPNSGSSLSYEWTFNGQTVATAESFDISKIKMTESGTYSVKITAYSDTETSLTSNVSTTITHSVQKKQLPITWLGIDGTSEYSRIYNAEISNIDISYDTDAIVYEASDDITYSISVTEIKNATSYNPVITLTGDCATKYYISDAQKTKRYTVDKKEVELLWGASEYSYTKSNIAPSVSIASGICLDDDVTVSGSEGKIVPGTYTSIATLDGIHSSNYVIKSEQLRKDYTINPAVITIAWASTTQIYNARDLQPTVTPIGLQGDDTVAGLNISVTKAKNAGTHTCTVTINNSNYVIANEDKTHEFVIKPATLEVYFTSTVKTYNSVLQKPTVATSELRDGDMESSLGLSVTGATNAGIHSVTASITNTNYVLSNPVFEEFEIKKAAITVLWPDNKNLVYNGEMQYLPVQNFTGVYPSDAASVSVSANAATSSHALYSSTPYISYADLADATGNYELVASSATANFYIQKKALTATWGNKNHTYDGNAFIPSIAINTGIVDGDTVNISLSSAKVNAGTYEAIASIDNENYSLSNPKVPFVIAPMDITVLWSGESFVYNREANAPTAALNSAIIAGDSVPISVVGAQVNIGNYTATATTTNTNYNITNKTQSFSITPKNISVIWSNTTLTYNATVQHPTAVATVSGGVISGDTVQVNVTGGQKNAAVEYVATATSANPNYVIENNTMTYDILPLVVDVSFSNTTRTYTGGYLKPTATLIGKPSSDSVTLVITVNGNTNGAIDAADDYLVQVSTTNPNYILNDETTTCIFVISAKQLTVNWSNLSQVYNATALKPGVSFTGVASGDTVEPIVTVDGSIDGKIDAGTYTASVTISDSNYVINSGATKTFNITKKTLSVSWSDLSLTYTGSSLKPTVTLSGMVNGETVVPIVTVDGSSDGKVNAGTYTANVSISNSNYRITSNMSASFTIEVCTLQITWDGLTQVYTGGLLKPTATLVGVLDGDSVTVTVKVDNSTDGKIEVGSYTAVVSISNSNYKLEQSQTTKTFTIIDD